ncbi:filament-like plant protein isoform X2 [Cornus florida]|nr:filament-like plant protein isoform X2 [Cornus florida]
MAFLKQQLEAEEQKNLALEDRVGHLDGALKECVRQLRQAKEEQEQRINEAVAEKTREWESTKLELESQLIEFQTRAESSGSLDLDLPHKLESLEKDNSALKLELLSRSEELELTNIERDLSIQAAETASKQHLESIKKVAKLEAECQRLQAMARKSFTANNHKSIAASSIYVESLTASQSNNGERLNAVERDARKINCRIEPNESEESCSDSWASALIAELDQFKNGIVKNKNLAACSVDIDIMDDFLEMERLAALPDIGSKSRRFQSEAVANQSANEENPLRSELDAMNGRMAELEGKLEKIEAEKAELQNALTASQDSLKASQFLLTQAEMRLEELQRELSVVNESKELLEFQLIGMEVETRTLSAKVESLKVEVEKERSLSAEMAVKCRGLEDELMRKSQKIELQQAANSNGELKMKQEEDLAVAAGKLAECQKTIASLGRQLKSLATLEDFLIDTENLPGLSGGGSLIPKDGGELWKLHSNNTFTSKSDLDPPKVLKENAGPLVNGNNEESPASSSSTSSSASSNHVSSAKSRNGFVKLFSRSKSGIQLENQQG